jgi:hypothetical protein
MAPDEEARPCGSVVIVQGQASASTIRLLPALAHSTESVVLLRGPLEGAVFDPFEPLGVRPDAIGRKEPVLATSWGRNEVDPDSKTGRRRARQAARFLVRSGHSS